MVLIAIINNRGGVTFMTKQSDRNRGHDMALQNRAERRGLRADIADQIRDGSISTGSYLGEPFETAHDPAETNTFVAASPDEVSQYLTKQSAPSGNSLADALAALKIER
jgi:hypothetical protein